MIDQRVKDELRDLYLEQHRLEQRFLDAKMESDLIQGQLNAVNAEIDRIFETRTASCVRLPITALDDYIHDDGFKNLL